MAEVGDYVKFLFDGGERRGTVEKEEWEGVIRYLTIREKDTAICRRVKPDAVTYVLIKKDTQK